MRGCFQLLQRRGDGAGEAGDDRANLAVEVFSYTLRKHLGAYFAVLGELDAVVFTGTAGVALPALRARVCEGLGSLGLELEPQLNLAPRPDARGVSDISHPRASVRLLVVPTDERRMVAGQAAEAVGLGQLGPAILANRRPIPIGISVRHVHLSAEHVAALYGAGHTLTFRSPLSQPGQFACQETVDLVGPKHRIDRVRVLGPERPSTQVEIARTECFALGVQAPVRMSGDLARTPGLHLEGPAGAVDLPEGVICASRHLHLSPEEALLLGLRDRDEISVRVEGEQSLIFNRVAVRVHPEYRLDMHIDTDEANAARLDQGAVGYVESVDLRG